jgi:hypothetical protein
MSALNGHDCPPTKLKPNSVPLPRSRDYRSKALTCAQIATAIAAHDYAKAMGHTLNLSLDIHWAWTRFASESVWNGRKVVPALLESQRHWLANHGVAFFSILVREAPPPSLAGEHAHQFIHVPASLQSAFIQHVRDFLRGRSRHQKHALQSSLPYNTGKFAYILKGATPAACKFLLRWLPSDFERERYIEGTEHKKCQGVIYGKRLLISQTLGPKARQSVGKRDAGRFSDVYPVAVAA